MPRSRIIRRCDAAALDAAQKTLRRQLHETIQKVGDDYGRRHSFNTAIAALMELLNHVGKFNDMSDQGRAVRHEAFEAIVLLLNPITPHVSHALWQVLGHAETLLEDVPFPQADPAALVRDAVTLAVQVNGKLRATIEMAPMPREAAEAAGTGGAGGGRVSWRARRCAKSSWCRARSSISLQDESHESPRQSLFAAPRPGPDRLRVSSAQEHRVAAVAAAHAPVTVASGGDLQRNLVRALRNSGVEIDESAGPGVAELRVPVARFSTDTLSISGTARVSEYAVHYEVAFLG